MSENRQILDSADPGAAAQTGEARKERGKGTAPADLKSSPPERQGHTAKILDLGADHRLADPSAYARYYDGPHAGVWTYGLPELPGHRELIGTADRVANTGCYAVAVTLALAPLLAAGIAEPADLVVVAASGTSGAGRAARRTCSAARSWVTCRRTKSARTSTSRRSSRPPARRACP